MNYRRTIWPFVTHALVAVVVFTAAYYASAFLAIGAAIDKCGTDTDHTLSWSAARGKVGMSDVVCDWTAPGHTVQVYRASQDGSEQESLLHYSTNTFHMPRASWTPRGELVIEVPPARSLSIDPGVKDGVMIKFGRVQ